MRSLPEGLLRRRTLHRDTCTCAEAQRRGTNPAPSVALRGAARGQDARQHRRDTDCFAWRFTGQREDATIGLYYFNARYLDPVLGRFTQPDTIVPQPRNPQTLNRSGLTLSRKQRSTVATQPAGASTWSIFYLRTPLWSCWSCLPPSFAKCSIDGIMPAARQLRPLFCESGDCT
ncbi:MAG TPA: RHS repeat-associated core domain-containing protein [Anaerolineae bacterium]|nr:RHS repeat-associated core domain-containing protein [Anaerolineae bacterium]